MQKNKLQKKLMGSKRDFKFFRNGDVTTAVIKGCEYDASDKIFKITDYIEFSPKYCMKEAYVGVATKNPDDAEDESFAKSLALKRAMDAHNKDYKENLKKFMIVTLQTLYDTDKDLFCDAFDELRRRNAGK